MINNQAVMNRIWCRVILEELTRFGVTEVCIAPGSRSTPLTLEADANQQLNIHTHFDERGLGFLALGLAKASHSPVAIIVTSGTAVANLLPAIAEAKLTGEKLVVLSADRPQQLVGCGANQAIEQRGIFAPHTRAELNLPSPSEQFGLPWLLSSLDEVMHQQAQQGSAVHINCPFPEPLYGEVDETLFKDYQETVSGWRQSHEPYCLQYGTQAQYPHRFCTDLFSKKGLVIIGRVERDQAASAIEFAHRLGWPVLCDPQSGVSSDWAHYDVWLQLSSASHPEKNLLNQCTAVIQFGSRIISKRLNQWLDQHVSTSSCDYIYVDPSADRNNQSHLQQTHYRSEVADWCQWQLNQLSQLPLSGKSETAGWGDALQVLSRVVATKANAFLEHGDCLTEVGLSYAIPELLKNVPKEATLFFGNSLFVRLVDMFSSIDSFRVHTNRGASGIDGLVATSVGVQRALSTPMLVFIGDTSLLYDLNSLALLSHQKSPVVIVVTNNDGGAIFDLLPVPKQQKEALYQMPHGYQFEYAAKQFGLAYDRPNTLSQCLLSISTHLNQGCGALVVEVITPSNQASEQLVEFSRLLHDA
ncbi:2-succinyl-5-enolpyruvyl-6-hydroxy-3-cyclohexene-1-carboxylic-acid synthase [Vibrio genomosp. F10 str. 9ZC157]|uniref:2-succinyl-5-enolpyruvyl-6-hydroxy-3-cyclohexene-1-carboxylate synthase n=1 Tax=Vibrio genomosp. F10 str. ZF-129 TaxID=1187848 RepID=A0A1E5BIF1_9VIBR|nr:2-succinyl-5-enolpyruvyl-6-hydroxy-3-cyclohexene-1-carboxylic-acid synthase [Vibrio genomosp. F10]OEE36965.1 2-succinyl-5-enolpyruvyl-6-hydroxy-3-cyclohexene-1-carboxylic-acid synthase [Vibrio genomosp. F10 str. ZF-129]OEE95969.1 2-succinyl-5-enolpyruvyl-6-hydroxy-3-cyclohexene-1-carboxylic-acid synthase [Vibrio genomosp. F10 str. 9ZC157]